MWQVTQLLANADKLSDKTKAALAPAGTPAATTSTPPAETQKPAKKK
jgi:hypothetical protein